MLHENTIVAVQPDKENLNYLNAKDKWFGRVVEIEGNYIKIQWFDSNQAQNTNRFILLEKEDPILVPKGEISKNALHKFLNLLFLFLQMPSYVQMWKCLLIWKIMHGNGNW